MRSTRVSFLGFAPYPRTGARRLFARLEYLKETQSLDTTGAFQLADRDVAEPIDLGRLLYSYAPNVREAKPGCAEVADDKVLAAKSGSGVLGGGADAGASAKGARTRAPGQSAGLLQLPGWQGADNDRLRRSAGDQLGWRNWPETACRNA